MRSFDWMWASKKGTNNKKWTLKGFWMHKDQQFIQNQAHNQLEELGFAFLFGGGGCLFVFARLSMVHF